jgi:hypothetical protein
LRFESEVLGRLKFRMDWLQEGEKGCGSREFMGTQKAMAKEKETI